MGKADPVPPHVSHLEETQQLPAMPDMTKVALLLW